MTPPYQEKRLHWPTEGAEEVPAGSPVSAGAVGTGQQALRYAEEGAGSTQVTATQ